MLIPVTVFILERTGLLEKFQHHVSFQERRKTVILVNLADSLSYQDHVL